MQLRFLLRHLGPVILIVSIFVLTSTTMTHWLLWQHAEVTRELRKHIDNQRIVDELRECLTDLFALQNAHVESVTVLHDRVRVLIARLNAAADSQQKQLLCEQLRNGFEAYYQRWSRMPPITEASHELAQRAATLALETDVLRKCQALDEYNSERIEELSARHERNLDQLAWGMALVGGLGGTSGAIVGYGIARTLLKSMHQLRVQLHDVAGKLDPKLSEIVVTGTGDFGELYSDVEQLRHRIETILSTLHQRESEVRRAEQLAAVGQLAAGVGHELRNPLTSIKLLVQTGLQDGRLDQDDLNVIDGEIRRMERTLQTFLDFARPPKMERRPTDLARLIQQVAKLLQGRAEQQRVELQLTMPEQPVILPVDPEQLRQVFVNLWINALDAMPHGGTLSVELDQTEDGVVVSIRDTGPGISSAIFPQLFQPFASTKDTGLGLGLVISKRIIESHQGTIRAENDLNGGACLTLTLPRMVQHG